MAIEKVLKDTAINYFAEHRNNNKNNNPILHEIMDACLYSLNMALGLGTLGNITITYSKGQGLAPSNVVFYLRDSRQSKSGTDGVYIVLMVDKGAENSHNLRLSLTQGKWYEKNVEDPLAKKAAANALKLNAKVISNNIYDSLFTKQDGFKFAHIDKLKYDVSIIEKVYSFTTVTGDGLISDIKSLVSQYLSLAKQCQDDVKDRNAGNRQYALGYREIRTGQARFRHEVLSRDGCCLVTGCEVKAALEAAHIIPHSELVDFNVSNGLTLRADIHRLFDAGLLSINKDGLIIISPTLRSDPEICHYHRYHRKRLVKGIPELVSQYLKSRHYVEMHMDLFAENEPSFIAYQEPV